jgi:hypothetical protein
LKVHFLEPELPCLNGRRTLGVFQGGYRYHRGLASERTRNYAHANEQLALTLRPAPAQAEQIREALAENTGG